MNQRYVCLFLAVVLCFSILQPITETTREEPYREHIISQSITSAEYYVVHVPIAIESDQDFIDYGFPGDGSTENPYRIEQLNITSSAYLGMAVSVRDTHAFFIVRNCHIVSEYIGIAILNIASGTGCIVNNTLLSSSGNGGGIAIDTDNCTISDNRCINWGQGIHLNQASQCIISRNNVSDSTYQGINIRYSNNNTITRNRIANSTQHGLVFVGTSGFNVVYNNTFIGNGNVAEYTIDNTRNGSLRSQGYDEGSNNTWYDANSKTGNIWSDYSGFGSYGIDGPSNSFDLYPSGSSSSQVYIIIVFSTALVLTLFLSVIGYRRFHK